MTNALPDRGQLSQLRRKYHESMCQTILAIRGDSSTIADSGNVQSRLIANGIADRLGFPLCSNPTTGQSSGSGFTGLTAWFIENAFGLIRHIRPGRWHYSVSQSVRGIAQYEQYKHLDTLQRVLREHTELYAALGGDYLVTPDIVVGRESVSDSEINALSQVILPSDDVAKLSPMRTDNDWLNQPRLILHASISCKWTMRSDRAQNTRTEALNLIRNRKGRLPHIVAVTMEPLPSRLASLALGTGDLDCVYHGALNELIGAVNDLPYEDSKEFVSMLVEGNRLRDISDLPLDLAA